MGHLYRGNRYLLIACSLSALMGLGGSVQAAGNGEIVLVRTVQPQPVGTPAIICSGSFADLALSGCYRAVHLPDAK